MKKIAFLLTFLPIHLYANPGNTHRDQQEIQQLIARGTRDVNRNTLVNAHAQREDDIPVAFPFLYDHKARHLKPLAQTISMVLLAGVMSRLTELLIAHYQSKG